MIARTASHACKLFERKRFQTHLLRRWLMRAHALGAPAMRSSFIVSLSRRCWPYTTTVQPSQQNPTYRGWIVWGDGPYNRKFRCVSVCLSVSWSLADCLSAWSESDCLDPSQSMSVCLVLSQSVSLRPTVSLRDKPQQTETTRNRIKILKFSQVVSLWCGLSRTASVCLGQSQSVSVCSDLYLLVSLSRSVSVSLDVFRPVSACAGQSQFGMVSLGMSQHSVLVFLSLSLTVTCFVLVCLSRPQSISIFFALFGIVSVCLG